jgi:hypothetical protein
VPAPPAPTEEAFAPDSADWGVDGGVYHPLGAAAMADTLPAAPAGGVDAEPADTPAPLAEARPVPGPVPPVDGPAQTLGREAALARPLLASARGGGRLLFYSAWDAPAGRASLVGLWAPVGACGAPVRLGYEQAVPGVGAVRGAGEAPAPPPWEVALVVPRQHCTAAAARWRGARPPRPEEAALLSTLLEGDPPQAVVAEGEAIWASSARRAVAARIAGGRAVEGWSAVAPEGASMRLLGVWEGAGLWAAVEAGGRVVRVWRVAR